MNVNCLEGSKHFHTVSFDSKENIVILINQKKLPHQFSLVKTTDFYQTAAAIQDMTVRGAGAIGATAAFGFAQGCNSFKDNSLELFEKHWKKRSGSCGGAGCTALCANWPCSRSLYECSICHGSWYTACIGIFCG